MESDDDDDDDDSNLVSGPIDMTPDHASIADLSHVEAALAKLSVDLGLSDRETNAVAA
jgi:hypothetical protein